jgi:hypothetical protein
MEANVTGVCMRQPKWRIFKGGADELSNKLNA